MASTEAAMEALKYQISVLKVSIHCEGCKKKVKKVLQSIDGVYKTTIDSQQQKVTVTGNVAAEALIRKLLKTGKHAELWPEQKPNNPSQTDNGGGGGGKKKNKNKNKNKNKANSKPIEPSDHPENNHFGSDDDSSTDAPENPAAANPDNSSLKINGKEPLKSDAKDVGTISSFSNGDKAVTFAAGGAGGDGGKKKGKKGQKDNNGCGGGGGGGEVSEETRKPASLPLQHDYNFPVYPTPAAPAYMVSYSTAQPSLSYLYSTHPPAAGSYYIPTAAARASGSYDIFSEENANACSVM